MTRQKRPIWNRSLPELTKQIAAIQGNLLLEGWNGFGFFYSSFTHRIGVENILTRGYAWIVASSKYLPQNVDDYNQWIPTTNWGGQSCLLLYI
jgi:hypothetical protein